MKKIMFNDKYGLTQAVLEGRKTQTRRIVPIDIVNRIDMLCLLDFNKEPLKEEDKDYNCYENSDGDFIDVRLLARYRVGEEVSVAQKYVDVLDYNFIHLDKSSVLNDVILNDASYKAGKENKMFVKAKFMPHSIKMANIRIERLQDISKEDCLKEGVKRKNERYVVENQKGVVFYTNDPTLAFRCLIDKTCGKGTWDSNPYVFVYDFELVK